MTSLPPSRPPTHAAGRSAAQFETYCAAFVPQARWRKPYARRSLSTASCVHRGRRGVACYLSAEVAPALTGRDARAEQTIRWLCKPPCELGRRWNGCGRCGQWPWLADGRILKSSRITRVQNIALCLSSTQPQQKSPVCTSPTGCVEALRQEAIAPPLLTDLSHGR